MITAYIAGPLRGDLPGNVAQMDRAAAFLRSLGWNVVNPCDLDRGDGFDPAEGLPPGTTFDDVMRRDLAALADCDTIVMLPGWEKSEGARKEMMAALEMGLRKFECKWGSDGAPYIIDSPVRAILEATTSTSCGCGEDCPCGGDRGCEQSEPPFQTPDCSGGSGTGEEVKQASPTPTPLGEGCDTCGHTTPHRAAGIGVCESLDCGCDGPVDIDDARTLLANRRRPGTGFYRHTIRTFSTGATRDTNSGKYDPEGFLSPAVLMEFCRYMHANRVQSDGTLRDSDNWQKGIPLDAYMKSLLRHVFDLWMIHRTGHAVRPETGEDVTLHDALGGCLFNVQGYWHESLKEGE